MVRPTKEENLKWFNRQRWEQKPGGTPMQSVLILAGSRYFQPAYHVALKLLSHEGEITLWPMEYLMEMPRVLQFFPDGFEGKHLEAVREKFKQILRFGYDWQGRNILRQGYRIIVNEQDKLVEGNKSHKRGNAHNVSASNRLNMAASRATKGYVLPFTEASLEAEPMILYSMNVRLRALELTDDADQESKQFLMWADGLVDTMTVRTFGFDEKMRTSLRAKIGNMLGLHDVLNTFWRRRAEAAPDEP